MLILRPVVFLENFLMLTGLITRWDFWAGGIKGDIKMPMIAAREHREVAANSLLGAISAERRSSNSMANGICLSKMPRTVSGAALETKALVSKIPNFMVNKPSAMGVAGKTAALMTELKKPPTAGSCQQQPRSSRNAPDFR